MLRLGVSVILCFCFGIIEGNIDCSLFPLSDPGDLCDFFGSYLETFYCYHPYKCCTGAANGCCFDESGSNWFTTVELLALILNATALFFVGLLALVICGATYCNDKEDASHLFMSNRK